MGRAGLHGWASQMMLIVKQPPAKMRKRLRFDPWIGKILWKRVWQPTPMFLSGEAHGSLEGYSP